MTLILSVIVANDDLKKFLGKCRDGKVRIVKISIENGKFCSFLGFLARNVRVLVPEQLVLASHKDVKSTWEKDFDKCITPLIEENQPCYLLYR